MSRKPKTVREEAPPSSTVPWKGLVTLLFTAGLLYGHTLSVPWYFDDHEVILNNPQVLTPGQSLSGFFGPRGVALLTFAVNYHFAGQAVASYHLINILIHLLCTLLVYRLLKRIFDDARPWAWLGALIFLAHPLQTQAVTYVVQRMTSLAALFFLLALELFLRFREERRTSAAGWPFRSRFCYAAALIAGALAVFTKENTAVLPLALILYIRCFDREDRTWRPLLISAAPFALAPLALAVVMLAPALSGSDGLATVTGVSTTGVTPWRYLATEFPVFWIYLRLLLLPYGQTLDYGYPLATSLLELRTLLALAALLALGGWGWRVRHRLPEVAFGLGWFFLALAVESSIIPLDPLFEHRLYLPMFGFVTALIGAFRLIPRQGAAIGLLLVIFAGYAGLTWQRNALWNDPLAFSADNVQKMPHNDRAFFNLAVRTINNGERTQGIALLRQSLQRFPESCQAYMTLAELAREGGELDKGIAILQQAAANCSNKALAYNNLGFFYGLQQQPDKLFASLEKAKAADPHYAESYFNAGRFLAAGNRLTEAEEAFRAGFRESQKNPAAYVDFGRLLERQGRREEALEAYRRALRLEPLNRAAAAGIAANQRP